ncbi:fungal specific transcription factor domain-containing protein [Colletotrichum cuscutae]|uniref:Fungal specific transcription factor domain-containing protein n=1 Tax=Colletotrichum cuscutae TaxID=1209917 RepID=A0AAI9VDJ2_9PEZI|nr:fungal specific transcription factor domain-containing protein [Colletotrichum cuscutae]
MSRPRAIRRRGALVSESFDIPNDPYISYLRVVLAHPTSARNFPKFLLRILTAVFNHTYKPNQENARDDCSCSDREHAGQDISRRSGQLHVGRLQHGGSRESPHRPTGLGGADPEVEGGLGLYISALEERIAFLEARMPDYAEDHFVRTSSVATPPEPKTKDPRRNSRDSLSDDEQSSLVNGVAYLSLCASGTTDTAPEPFYLGSSSGATIARMIQSSIFHSSGGKAAFDAMSTSQALSSTPQWHLKVSVSSNPEESQSKFPCPEQAEVLFDVFSDRLHTRWPILDRKLYTKLFQKQYDGWALSIQHRSIMHLINAISARFLQLMKKPCDVDPQKHLTAAIEPMDYILEQHNLATVQFLLLLAVHGTRSPYGAVSWSQVRYAVTLCIELGLHRKESNTSTHDLRDLEIRRRVFWSCYCLDRMTSAVLGRTFAIADR